MEKFFVFAVRVNSDFDSVTISEKVFSSIDSAFNKFYYLVGQFTSFLPCCSVSCYDYEDSPYIKKVRITAGNSSVYVYLQKLS